MKMNEITGELLNRAISIFCAHAYRRHKEQQEKRPAFEPSLILPQILAQKHPFEDLTGNPASGSGAMPVPVGGKSANAPPRVYALRLGNDAYPHMKLALVEVYLLDEFVFAVDRHDTFHFEPDVPGYQAWCELKEINRLLKESIEDAWHKAGLPTLRGLREERFTHPDLVRNLRAEGSTILILDDDESRAEILRRILEEAGYEAFAGPPGPRPNPDDTAVVRARKRADGGSLRLPAEYNRNSGDVKDLGKLIVDRNVALIVLDVSYRTGQGPRVAGSLRLDSRSQEIPILAVYSRRDFGPDPDLFTASLRRPYRTEAILQLVDQTLVRRSRGGSGIHKAVF